MSILFSTAASEDEAGGVEPRHPRIDLRRAERQMAFERRPTGDARASGDEFTLQLLCDGVVHGGAPGEEPPPAQGDVILFDLSRLPSAPPGCAHVLTLHLPREIVEAAAPKAGLYHGRVLPRPGSGPLADLMRSLARRGDVIPARAAVHLSRAAAELVALAIGTDEAVATRPAAGPMMPPLERARAFIDVRLSDPRLDAGMVAAGAAISRSVLYRLFAPAGGVAQYIMSLRLERMRDALRRPTEQRSVSALAYDLGFSSESHCSRAFRAAYGMPPGRYRSDTGAAGPDGARASMADG